MPEGEGLVCGYLRPAGGQWREIGWPEIEAWRPEHGLIWVHLDFRGAATRAWLAEANDIDPLVAENLLAEETRPRAVEIAGYLLINLRGVNLNPGANPEDMVSLRMWIGPERIVTTRHRRLMAVNDIRERIAAGRGPDTPGAFLNEVAGRLVDRMAPVIDTLYDAEDELEDKMVTGQRAEIRARLTELRRQAISLRRYLAPQREAMGRLQAEPLDWLTARDRARLRETSDRITRYVEDLDAIRERAAVIQDEIANRVAEQINRNMYILALVATILLPMSFVTGLLGINVDGIPGSAKTPWAFSAVVALLALVGAVEVWIMRRLKWI